MPEYFLDWTVNENFHLAETDIKLKFIKDNSISARFFEEEPDKEMLSREDMIFLNGDYLFTSGLLKAIKAQKGFQDFDVEFKDLEESQTCRWAAIGKHT